MIVSFVALVVIPLVTSIFTLGITIGCTFNRMVSFVPTQLFAFGVTTYSTVLIVFVTNCKDCFILDPIPAIAPLTLLFGVTFHVNVVFSVLLVNCISVGVLLHNP